MSGRRRILFVSMYPVGPANSGPTVRIERLLGELRARVAVDLIDGYRGPRRWGWWRYLLGGRLRGVSGVYVESSTALPGALDLAGLRLAKALGRPVLTYVRDAYQLFPDEYPPDGPVRRAINRAFPLAVRALRGVSTALAFPTRGLAEAVVGQSAPAALLPPGAPSPLHVPREAAATVLFYVGDLRQAAQGGPQLLRAVASARERGSQVELLCVTRPGGAPPAPHPPWLRVVEADAAGIPGLLGRVRACVIPRAPGRYNDLALPIKLMEYLSYGRPLLVTPRRETAAVVAEAGCGIVVGDGVDELADGLVEVWRAPESQLDAWSAAAHAAAAVHSWAARADEILEFLATRRPGGASG